MAKSAQQIQFEKMLAMDKVTWENLVKIAIHSVSWKKSFTDFDAGKRTVFKTQAQRDADYKIYQAKLLEWYRLRLAFDKRQTAYKTDTGLKGFVTEAKDKVTNYFKSWVDKISGMLGLGAPPVVAVAVVLGAVIAVERIAKYISDYKVETETGYSATAKLASELSATNPELAAAILEGKQEIEEGKTGSFFQELGEGAKSFLKWTGIIGGVSVAGFALYKIGQSQGWFKSKK